MTNSPPAFVDRRYQNRGVESIHAPCSTVPTMSPLKRSRSPSARAKSAAVPCAAAEDASIMQTSVICTARMEPRARDGYVLMVCCSLVMSALAVLDTTCKLAPRQLRHCRLHRQRHRRTRRHVPAQDFDWRCQRAAGIRYPSLGEPLDDCRERTHITGYACVRKRSLFLMSVASETVFVQAPNEPLGVVFQTRYATYVSCGRVAHRMLH